MSHKKPGFEPAGGHAVEAQPPLTEHDALVQNFSKATSEKERVAAWDALQAYRARKPA